jgi:hypothetical protein
MRGLAVAAVTASVSALAGCGGSGGVAPTSAAVRAPQCPITRLSSKLTVGTCLSPDHAWRLHFREGTANGRLFLARRGHGVGAEMYHSNNSCCSDLAWAKPHLLLFLDYPLVESLDPTTRVVTQLGALDDVVVSPDGRWIAGTGASGPEDPVATTVYVLAVQEKRCLVVPGTSVAAAGFTRDSKAVIVDRGGPQSGQAELRQFALSSLHDDCPPGQVQTQRVTSLGS